MLAVQYPPYTFSLGPLFIKFLSDHIMRLLPTVQLVSVFPKTKKHNTLIIWHLNFTFSVFPEFLKYKTMRAPIHRIPLCRLKQA